MLTGGKEKLGYETQKPIRLLELLLRTAMRDQGADLGIFVTLTAPTDGMRVQAAREGFLTLGKTRVPRLQFWHLTERYFHTGVPEIILPQQWMVDTRQQAEMHHGEEQVWLI